MPTFFQDPSALPDDMLTYSLSNLCRFRCLLCPSSEDRPRPRQRSVDRRLSSIWAHYSAKHKGVKANTSRKNLVRAKCPVRSRGAYLGTDLPRGREVWGGVA